MASHTYSLWLTPANDVYDDLARLIGELAEQHGGPRFPPHLTLLGSVVGTEADVVERTTRIARQTQALPIEFDGLGAEDVYFRTLYLVAKPAPALMAANQLARQVFADERTDPFRPHLSLLYGDYSAATKRLISGAIEPQLPVGCEILALDLYQTEPPVEAWRLVQRFPLTTSG